MKCKALLTALAVTAMLPGFCQISAGAAAPANAIGSVSAGGTTTYYYNTRESGGATAMWNEAVVAGTATVTLLADWTSTASQELVAGGTGAVYEGVIYVPSGCEITIDLNGHSIDRALEFSIVNGEVICIQKGGVLNLTDTGGGTGKVTGGNNTQDAGGILVQEGGTLNLWGGTITGNNTEGSGGGILLAGADSTLFMTGGSVTGNDAGVNGGGIASVDGSIRIVQGDITQNSADISGGGMYLQGGSAEISAGHVDANSAATGGGICTSSEALLTLKGTPSVQKNVAVSEDGGSAGGGIFAMSARPIRLSGAPVISMNTNADGTQSNLMFWMDNDRVYTGRVEDAGLTPEAKIGVGFTGGTDRDMIIIPAWQGQNVFSVDTATFSILEKDGNLLLRRPLQKLGTWTIIAIVIAVTIVVSLIAFAVGSALNKQRKKKRKKKRSSAK